jgi:hypothetical protein
MSQMAVGIVLLVVVGLTVEQFHILQQLPHLNNSAQSYTGKTIPLPSIGYVQRKLRRKK